MHPNKEEELDLPINCMQSYNQDIKSDIDNTHTFCDKFMTLDQYIDNTTLNVNSRRRSNMKLNKTSQDQVDEEPGVYGNPFAADNRAVISFDTRVQAAQNSQAKDK